MKVEKLKIGTYYQCLLTGRNVLAITTKDPKDNDITAGVIGIAQLKDNGEIQIGYNVINVYDGQLVELDEQPKLKVKNKIT